ncbi:MAG: hypothetical protein R8P61_17785 [Bacteroidia bacterium]|nr:hypothetical protein [Bacteroidia bacterium]
MQDIRMDRIRVHPLFLLGNTQTMSSPRKTFRHKREAPTLLTGEENLPFFEIANETAQEWMVGYLQKKREMRRIR